MRAGAKRVTPVVQAGGPEVRNLAVAEEGTVTWYAFKNSDTSYGIFDTFATGDARTAHINGQIPAALAEVSADLLARAPDIQPVSLLAVK
jgi:hypothetical protein